MMNIYPFNESVLSIFGSLSAHFPYVKYAKVRPISTRGCVTEVIMSAKKKSRNLTDPKGEIEMLNIVHSSSPRAFL